MLNGVAVNDDSAFALLTSLEKSEVENILTFYHTNITQKRKEGQQSLRISPVLIPTGKGRGIFSSNYQASRKGPS